MNASDQIKLEKALVQSDADKYYNKQDKLRDKHLGDQVDSHAYIIRTGVLSVADKLEMFATKKTKGAGGKYNALLRRVAARVDPKTGIYYDYPAIAYIGLQAIFQAMQKKRGANWNHLAHTIAARLEADHKARLFEAHEPRYFKAVIKSFSEQMVQQYQHKHRVLMMKFNEFEIKWEPWDAHEKLQVANKILIAVIDTLPDVFFRNTYKTRNKTVAMIDTLASADDWFAEFERESGFLHPSHPPLIVEPIPWVRDETTGIITGGYHTHGLAKSLPFVKTRSQAHRDYIAGFKMEEHISAINRMQSTKWQINTNVLDVQTEMFKLQLGTGLPKYEPREVPNFPEHIAPIPNDQWTEAQQEEVSLWKQACKFIYTENRINKGKVLAYKTIADTAREYRNYEAFYFVYNADFRGRVYCATTGLSPQGEDLAKGLLHFGTSREIGSTGLFWLAVHGAGKYGYDKASLEERVSWVYDREDQFKAVINDPISTRSFWGSADKPWQFLAFIFEWAKTNYGSDTTYASSLPIALDGSCNGIQHYSAMLRDSIGGAATNLTDHVLPADIYQNVSEILNNKLMENDSQEAHLWLSSSMDRKLTKRPVMTLPYGSTRQSCKEYIFDWILEHKHEFPVKDTELLNLTLFLTPLLWESIGEVVIAARAAMQWLQKATSEVLTENPAMPIKWLSPAGFPVYQGYMETDTVRVSTMITGTILARVRLTSEIPSQTEVNKFKQRLGVAPNFIHSIDSAHMVKTINAIDLPGYAMIHDDFGTHAGNTEALWNQIRESFVDMYEQYKPLEDWANEQPREITQEPPEYGTLDIRNVLNSTYFFV